MKRKLEINHGNLVIYKIQLISKEIQRNRTMKIVINHDIDTRNYVKNGMDLDWYYIARIEGARREKNPTISVLLHTK